MRPRAIGQQVAAADCRSAKTRAAKGHDFGLELSEEDRRVLTTFLKAVLRSLSPEMSLAVTPCFLACHNGPVLMLRFAETCEAVASTTKKSEKVRLVAQYLRSLPTEDACRAALFLSARAFPHWEEKVLAVGGSLIWQVVGQLAGAELAAMEATYRQHGDLGSMAEELLTGKAASRGLNLADVAGAFETLAERRGAPQKVPVLEDFLRHCGPLEAKYAIKIITGELRIGLREGLVEEAIALAYGRPLSDVQRANMLTGDVGETVRLAAEGKLHEARLRLLHPISFMLASPLDSPEEALKSCPGVFLVEDKYDGIRAQAHKRGSEVKIFSRTMDEVAEFQELVPSLRALPGDFVLDGEIVGWREGRALPFTLLQTRLGRKEPDLWLPLEIPVNFLVFDLLYRDGELLLDCPLTERRRRLEALVGNDPDARVRLSPAVESASAEELARTFDAALARGNEGLMAKVPGSPYTPGRRGKFWLKLKRPMATLDVVVTAVEYGHGKRRGLLSDYTFAVRAGERLVNIGKAYSGLTDEEILRLTEYFKQHTVEDQGFRRAVEPAVVLEVAFNNIQRSTRHESGYALRFPRIVRVRPDKSPAEVDTLERVTDVYEAQFLRRRERGGS